MLFKKDSPSPETEHVLRLWYGIGIAMVLLALSGFLIIILNSLSFQRILRSFFGLNFTLSSLESAPSVRETIRVVSEESIVIDTVKKATPAVVSVVAAQDVPILEKYFDGSPFSDSFGSGDPFGFLKDFTNRIPKYRQKGTEKQRVSAGTGFLVSSDGYILTNQHVVKNEQAEYTVILNSGKKYTASVLARDTLDDIAVLKVEADVPLPYLELGDSGSLQLGQTVIAIGYALGRFDNSISKGIVSGLARTLDAASGFGQSEHLEGIIQTDAAINPGNSGGPLLNINAQVIGMNVAIAQGSENIGFSLPINNVAKIYESVKTTGKIVRPFLGVRYLLINDEIKRANHLSVDHGALLVRGADTNQLAVIPGSPADKAGLQEYDIILEVDGISVDQDHSLAFLLKNNKVGDKVKLKITRDGTEKIVEVALTEMAQNLK